MTFSIVAHDAARAEWGVAVQTKYFAVGSVCPWARAGVGAVVTQAWGDRALGERGVGLLADGAEAVRVIEELLAADDKPALRQLGVVDRNGRAAAHTGDECTPWAGHVVRPGFCCQANMVAPDTVDAMVRAFEATAEPDLADRMLAALVAGQEAGGDVRGQQSAALLLVGQDRRVDLRVDDHAAPIAELARLRRLHELYHGAADPARFVPVDAHAEALRDVLARTGLDAVDALVTRENLRAKWDREARTIAPDALAHLLSL